MHWEWIPIAAALMGVGFIAGNVEDRWERPCASPIAVCAASCHTQGDRMAEAGPDRCICVPTSTPKSVAIWWRLR